MKEKRSHFRMLLILAAALALGACTAQRTVAPSKYPAPPKKTPELGARPAPGPSPDASHGIVSDLKHQAEAQMASGREDLAFLTLERAVRINPNDSTLWNMLAQIQLERGNLDQAEQLARKSNLLAGKDRGLRRRNWGIIAQALEKKGLAKEAAAARRRADN
jgi:cytochrome c-type biogenesis protein CcmH/NrfG